MTEFLTTPQGRRLAFDRSAGKGPGIVLSLIHISEPTRPY